jgi:hypothetical protein
MPGYVHTCSGCGARMQVHERYLGRTLRCTTCRTEFVADPVGAVVEVEPAAPDVGEEEPRRSRRFLPWLLLLVPLAALLWWLGQDQSGGFAASVFGVERAVGDLATLDAGEGLPVPVAFDSDSVKVLVQAAAGDPAGLEKLREEGRCLEVPAGTHVRILDLGSKALGARVRILDGDWASRIVWVPDAWIR